MKRRIPPANAQHPTLRTDGNPRLPTAIAKTELESTVKDVKVECSCVRQVIWDWDVPCALQWHAILGFQLLLHWAKWCGCYNVWRRLRHKSQQELEDDIVLPPPQLERILKHAALRMNVSIHDVENEIKIRKCVVFDDEFIDTWRKEQYLINPAWFTGINRWCSTSCTCAMSRPPRHFTKNVRLPTWRATRGLLCRREDDTDDWRDVYCHLNDVDYVA